MAATLPPMPNPEPLLRSAYLAFNARDYTGELISETTVRHSYQLKDKMITRMDVLEEPKMHP